jgi:tRNA G18 (ribose-2'-O)-methylase SpoU
MSWAHLEGPDDGRLEPFRTIRDPALVRDAGCFVAEGRRIVRDLLARAPHTIQRLVLTPSARDALGRDLEALPEDAVGLVVDSPATLRAVTGVRFHQGCVAIASLPQARTVQEVWAGVDIPSALWLVLEGVTDPDNVGTLFRSAASFGVSAVLLGPGCAHPLYRKALRTSVGTALWLPFAEARAWPGDLAWLQGRGLSLVALSPREDAEPLDLLGEELDGAVGLLLGSEERGLTDEAFGACERWARIPLRPEVDSLNVAAAGAIALYTFRRA